MSTTIENIEKAVKDFTDLNNKRVEALEKRKYVTPELEDQVNIANQAITDLTAKLADEQKKITDLENIAARPNGGAGDDKAIKNIAEFSRVVGEDVSPEQYNAYGKAINTYMRKGDKIDLRNELSVGTDPAGGYYVMPDTSGRIATLVYETTPMRQLANVVTISTDALEGFYDLDEAGSGWVGEQSSRTETTTPDVAAKWRIPVHELYAEPAATQNALDDSSFNLESWLAGKVSSKFSREENTAFITGDGVLKPRGILDYATAATAPTATSFNAIQYVDSGANGAFKATLPGDELIDLIFSLKNEYRQRASFLMSRLTMAEVRKLVDGQGNYLWQPDFTKSANGTLLGQTITEGEDMPALATGSLSIAFADFNEAYQIVDRQGIRLLRDPYTTKGKVKFYTTKRVGGGVVNFEAIKFMRFSA